MKVINTKESDSKVVVEEYFAKGIDIKSYQQIFTRKTQYLEKESTYKPYKYNFDKLLTYEEIEKIITNVNNLEVVNTEIIGKSVDNRNIYSIEIGKGNKTIMFEANIHAREVANTYFLIAFITKFLSDYVNNSTTAINIVDNYKLVIVLSANPDGYTMTLFGVDNLKNKTLYAYKNKENINFRTYKANANGVDLNRNFPSQTGGLYFKKYHISDTVSLKPSRGEKDYYPGEMLGNEPETQAIMYWISKHIESTYLYISMHSSGRTIYTGKPYLSREYIDLSYDAAEVVNYINGYIILDSEFEDVGMGNDGTSTDYISELASDFKFSSLTGRLSREKYIMTTQNLKYKLGAITLETLRSNSLELKTIKDEYYDYKIEEVIYKLITSK